MEDSVKRELRVQLAGAYRIIDHLGLTTYLQNHITARLPGTEEFLINAYGLSYDEITASSLVKIGLDGQVLEPGEGPFGRMVNPAGFVLHRAVHDARSDALCVLHTHTVAGTAVSAMKEGLLPISIESMQLGPVAYHDFEGVTMDLAECAKIASDLGDRRTLILRNHGLLTVGSTIAEAVVAMLILERACRVQVAALSMGRPITSASEEIAIKVARQASKFTPDNTIESLTFANLLRRIDRIDPKYRE
jgi:ribulose-5-phosphate 4-epimerase/fuculose-1-phosphate aldolase